MLQQASQLMLSALLSAAARHAGCSSSAAPATTRRIWAAAATAAGDALQPAAAAEQRAPLSSSQQQQQQQQETGLHRLRQQYLYQAAAGAQQQQQAPRLPQFRAPPAVPQPVPILQALQLVQANARARFPETVEAHVRLKVDPRRGDQMVRGAAVLPHSLGKPLRIAVFAEGPAADEARAAGADVVGSDTLVAAILDSKGKAIDFNAALATPDMMPKLVKLGRILGPKGLMPNPKVGTLTDNLGAAIGELRQGRVEFRMDRTGIVHAPIGRVAFEAAALHANMGALLAALLAAKPEAVKGGLPKYVRSVHVCSTMGRSVAVEVGSLVGAMQAAMSAGKDGSPAAPAHAA